MARRLAIPFKQLSPRIVGAEGAYRPARIQRFEIRGNFPTRDIREHGNPQLAGIAVDIPEYTVTLAALDVSIKLFSALTGTDPDNYPSEGVSVNDLTEVDIVADVRSDTVADYVKALLVRKARVQSARYAYSVDGDSTEEYTLGATTRYSISNDILVDTFEAAATSPQSLSETPEQLKSGNYALSVILDGVYLTEVASGPGSGEYSISGSSISFADTIESKLVVVYKASPTGENWTDVSDSTIPIVITGKNVPVEISTDNIPRVQSVNVNINLAAKAIKEQGNVKVVGYTYQIPEITGDLTVLDTDLDLTALFSTGNINSEDTEFKSCELLTARDLDLYIKLRDPADPCVVSGNVLKTIKVPNIQLTGETYTSNVGDNLGYVLNFKSADGNLIVYSGEPV